MTSITTSLTTVSYQSQSSIIRRPQTAGYQKPTYSPYSRIALLCPNLTIDCLAQPNLNGRNVEKNRQTAFASYRSYSCPARFPHSGHDPGQTNVATFGPNTDGQFSARATSRTGVWYQEALRRFLPIAGIRRNVGVLRCEPLKETFAARATERSPSRRQILMSVNTTYC